MKLENLWLKKKEKFQKLINFAKIVNVLMFCKKRKKVSCDTPCVSDFFEVIVFMIPIAASKNLFFFFHSVTFILQIQINIEKLERKKQFFNDSDYCPMNELVFALINLITMVEC